MVLNFIELIITLPSWSNNSTKTRGGSLVISSRLFTSYDFNDIIEVENNLYKLTSNFLKAESSFLKVDTNLLKA